MRCARAKLSIAYSRGRAAKPLPLASPTGEEISPWFGKKIGCPKSNTPHPPLCGWFGRGAAPLQFQHAVQNNTQNNPKTLPEVEENVQMKAMAQSVYETMKT